MLATQHFQALDPCQPLNLVPVLTLVVAMGQECPAAEEEEVEEGGEVEVLGGGEEEVEASNK